VDALLPSDLLHTALGGKWDHSGAVGVAWADTGIDMDDLPGDRIILQVGGASQVRFGPALIAKDLLPAGAAGDSSADAHYSLGPQGARVGRLAVTAAGRLLWAFLTTAQLQVALRAWGSHQLTGYILDQAEADIHIAVNQANVYPAAKAILRAGDHVTVTPDDEAETLTVDTDAAGGADGRFQATAYQAAAAAPAKPDDTTYTVATGVLTLPPSSSLTPPAAASGQQIYASVAKVQPSTATGATIDVSWSAWRQWDGSPGADPTLANVTTALGLAAVAAANRGKLIRRKTDETGYEYADEGDTTDIEDQLRLLAYVTADLHAGSPSTGWSDTTASSQGGITQARPDPANAAAAAALEGWAQARQATFGYHGVVRVPAAADPQQYRVEFAPAGGAARTDTLNHWHDLGVAGSWRYYTGPSLAGSQTVTLQATGSAAHVGTSRYVGELDRGKIADAAGPLLSDDTGGDLDFSLTGAGDAATLRGEIRNSAVDDAALADDVKDLLLPTFPAAGRRDKKVPKFDGNTLGWEPDATGPPGIVLSDEDPQDTGPAAPGGGDKASRDDHVHQAPWASLTGIPARVGKFSAADETKLDSLDATRLLPTFPAAGSRDGKAPIFDGDALGWETAPGGTAPATYKVLHTLSVTSSSQTFPVDFADVPDAAIIDVSFDAERLQASNSRRSEAYPLSVPDLKAGRRWTVGGVAGAYVQLTLNAAGTSLAVALGDLNATAARPLVITLSEILGGAGPPGPAGAGAGVRKLVKSVTQSPSGSGEAAFGADIAVPLPDVAEHEVYTIYITAATDAAFAPGQTAYTYRLAVPAGETSLSAGALELTPAAASEMLAAAAELVHPGAEADVAYTFARHGSGAPTAGTVTWNIYAIRAAAAAGASPTLANITSALGLDEVAAANRGRLIARHPGDEEGYDYKAPDTVGWIDSKATAVQKINAAPEGFDFAADEAGDRIVLTGPSTDDPWPTPSKFDGLTQVVLPADTDLMAVETAAGLRKIEVADVGAKVTEGLLDHVRIIQHGARTPFAAAPSGWTWDIENHLIGNTQRDPRHISLAATGGANAATARAWWAQVFQGGTARVRLKTDTSGTGVAVTCDAPARGIKQGQPFFLYDLILSADLSVTAATSQTTAQLPVEFSRLEADTDILSDTIDIEGATVTQVGPNVAKVVIDTDDEITAGDAIAISPRKVVSVAPPPYLAGFWGNAREGEPDIEVLRRRDLIVDDQRNATGVDITWSNGWTIRGLTVPTTGIGMLNDQSETLSPAPGSSLQGNVPAGDGAWAFSGGSSGRLAWTGKWPTNGIDLQIDIDMSDFRAGDRIHLTLATNNNDLWGSARTPDRGQDFYGSADRSRVSHSHLYELRPSSITDGTQIQIHLEAILQGDPDNHDSVGLLRAANVTLTYPPANPSVAHQVLTLGSPVENTSIDAVGPDAWLIPVAYPADNRAVNHLDVDSGDSVWEFTADLRNVLMELLSHADTTQAAWTFEVWTYVEGVVDWHRVRSYQMPGPTSGTSTAKPAVHIYFDSGPVLDGQQFVLVGRGLSGTASSASIGNMSLDLDTNVDTRFPATAVLAKGLLTTEQITGAENSRNSGQRTWPAPATGVNRWEQLIVLVKDGNGAQHQATFDVSGWRRLDESAQMNTAVFSQPQLGANQTLSRNADGRLTYDTGSASVQVLQAWLDIER